MSNSTNIMVTLPTDLAERMREAKLKPSTLLKTAVETALDGHDLGSFGARLEAVEKVVRAHSRRLAAVERTVGRGDVRAL